MPKLLNLEKANLTNPNKTIMSNLITQITRQGIADEMHARHIAYNGRKDEPDFLGKLFDLKKVASRDHRFSNAYDDIYQHTVLNNDYSDDWIYTDPRIGLLHCDDDTYLKFLAETIHPTVRTEEDDVRVLVDIYNRFLGVDGFEIIEINKISDKPVFEGRLKNLGSEHLTAKTTQIKKFLDSAYVAAKIKIMHENINTHADVAIGTAKELLETVCKSILQQKGVTIDTNWTLAQLLKATTGALDFQPKDATDPQKAADSIKKILGGVTSIVNGISELRNTYGSGHGKAFDFKNLESNYARLFVGMVSEIAVFYLSINGETAALVGDGEDDLPF